MLMFCSLTYAALSLTITKKKSSSAVSMVRSHRSSCCNFGPTLSFNNSDGPLLCRLVDYGGGNATKIANNETFAVPPLPI
ncbi:hypothetical protein B0H67DRAFT_302547 [Lasiosphaeris hirsuta]|uniref:Uncharacterized protein n=1 Tax=Lasiosphaeris hirsuta TaxID=260670 RepID=A0AA40A9T3_9PEZI|nr:hypothetical protein B0H67DRAFT_302547 [Lasiosphaeris hirsuta]